MQKFIEAVAIMEDDNGVNIFDMKQLGGKCWKNDMYIVLQYDAVLAKAQSPEFPAMWWLSIKRVDRQPIRDWRELQKIKNMIIGAEHDAVELFPAESRKVDTSNQYHLFVLKDSAIKFPFGYNKRLIFTPKEAERKGAKQRKL